MVWSSSEADVGTLSRKIAQGQATRTAMLNVAREEFGKHGYAETSVDEIVKRAKVTKGAFYHHFSGKEDLFAKVFEDVKRELSRAAFVTHVRHDPFLPPEEQSAEAQRFAEQTNDEVWTQLIERCRRYVELHTDPKIRRIALVDSRWVLSWQDWQRIEREYGVVLLRADMRRAMQRGLIPPLPVHVLAVVLAGALNEVCLLVANASHPEAALDEAMVVLVRLLEGLRADGSTSPTEPNG
jgi:AcrR family transcriptional regulator